MRAPLIHIGMPKAGSTFLKSSVFGRLSRNVVAPRDMLDVIHKDQLDRDDLRARIERLQPAPGETLILSNESMCGTRLTLGGRSIRGSASVTNLSAMFPDARILLVLREPHAFVRSRYAYAVQRGRKVGSLDEHVTRALSQIAEELDYGRMVRQWQDAFGRDRVLVIPFERLVGEPDATLHQISAFAGLRIVGPRRPGRENSSLKSERAVRWFVAARPLVRSLTVVQQAVWKKRRALTGKRGIPIYPFTERVLRWVDRPGATPLRLSPEARRLLDDAVREGNREASRAMGLDLGAYGYAV